MSLALWRDQSLPWALLASGDGAGVLHSVACSTWVISKKLADSQALHPPQIPTLGLAMGLCRPIHLGHLPMTSVRSGIEMSSHLLDGKTEA